MLRYIISSLLITLEYDWPWPVIPDSGAHNGISNGLDPAGRPYINFGLNTIEGAIPAEHRSPVFFTDVKPPPPDNFVEDHLGGNGWDYFDAFPEDWEVCRRTLCSFDCGPAC